MALTKKRDYLTQRKKAGRREYIERMRFGGEEAPAGYWDEPRFNAPGPPEAITPETTYQAPTRGKLFEQQWAGQESQRRSRLEALDRLKVQQGAKGLKTGRTPEQLGEIGLARRETLPGLFPEATTREAEVGKFEQMLPLEQQVARQETRQRPALSRANALSEIAGTLPPESPVRDILALQAAQGTQTGTIAPEPAGAEATPNILDRVLQQKEATIGAGMAGETSGLRGMVTPINEESQSMLNMLVDKRAEDEDSVSILTSLLFSLQNALTMAQTPEEREMLRGYLQNQLGYLKIREWQDVDSMLSQEQTGSGFMMGRHPLLWRKLGLTEDRFAQTADLARQIVQLIEGVPQ